MFDWLKSRYTKFLEAELVRIRAEHEQRLTELKSAHAEELKRVMNETAFRTEEIERLRRFLLPGMQPVYDTVRDQASAGSAPPIETDKYAHLTPWQRVQARDLEQQDQEIQERKIREKEAAKTVAQAPQAASGAAN